MYGPGQQLPPPPPPPMGGPGNGRMGIPLPPPPPILPRSQQQQQQHGAMLPPPPANPPSAHPTTYWNRQASYPAPQSAHPVAYNPNAYQNYQQQTMALPPPPPQTEQLVSATYIPGSDGWGPGVGIPPLYPMRHDIPTYSDYNTASTINTMSGRNNGDTMLAPPHDDGRTWNSLYRERSARQIAVPGRDVPDYSAAGPPTATLANPHAASPHVQESASTVTPNTASPEGLQWPLDRVLDWLAAEGFSEDWLRTFEALNLQGNLFLEIGKGHGNSGNLGMMHAVILPQLAVVQGARSDEKSAREQGRRLRRLVHKIVEQGPVPNGGLHAHRRETSLTSAGTEGGVEHSPGLPPGFMTTPTTAGTDGGSPGHPPFRSQSPGAAGWTRRPSTQRNSMFGDHGTDVPRSPHGDSTLRAGGAGHSRATSREVLQEAARHASPQLSPGLTSAKVAQGAAATKESKSIYSVLKSRKSERSPIESPTSPNGSRLRADMAFARANSALSGNRVLPGVNEEVKRFAFVTPDGWTYRLVDMTAVTSALALRHLVAENLGLPHSSDISLHLTSPGQSEHDAALSDELLLQARKSIGDHLGTLKLYVHIPPNSIPASNSNFGLDLNIANLRSAANNRISLTGRPLKDSVLRRLGALDTMESPVPMSASEATLVGGRMESLAKDSPADLRKPSGVWERGEFTEVEQARRMAMLDRAADLSWRQSDRRQPIYNKKPSLQPLDVKKDSTSIRGLAVDFDQPVHHRRSGEFLPNRLPPRPPSDSDTLKLIRNQSISHRPQRSLSDDSVRKLQQAAASAAIQSSGSEGGAFVPDALQRRALEAVEYNKQLNSGRRSPGSPRLPGQPTMSPGDVPFMIPDYAGLAEGSTPERPPISRNASSNSSRPSLTLQIDSVPALGGQFPTNTLVNRLKQQALETARSPDLSPTTASPSSKAGVSRRGSRRSYGPSFDVKEADVPWKRNIPQTTQEDEEDEDSDSDDSLFAKPIRPTAAVETPSAGSDELERDDKPSLTVETGVRFSTPTAADQKSASTDNAESDNQDPASSRHVPESASSNARSPDDFELKAQRRQSFMSDIWANRPPAEGIVDHLDEFFPNVNLDEPVVEEKVVGDASPTSPVSAYHGTFNKEFGPGSSNGKGRAFMQLSAVDDNSTLGSDQSTLKEDTITNVAQRQVRKSGGLQRGRSIREVVKSNFQHPPPFNVPLPAVPAGAPPGVKPPTRVNTLRQAASGALLRRKSTKMFGAKIEQVRPRGSRLIQLETIPQDTISTNKPQRQATFKWIKGQLIGKGTFGRVYLGMNITTGEPIAVKQVEIAAQLAGSKEREKEKIQEMVKSLDLEISMMQDLDHSNIVSYLGCEKKETSISIFLEYIPGGSVGSCLRKHGKFDEPIVSSLTRQTLVGLSYLHDKGILHRDLKADNILLDLDGTCKISDFGISKKTDNIYGNDSTNNMQGTVFWMAPEVVRSRGGGYSAKVDIWSLGCVVLEMFAGKRPWSKEEAVGAMFKLGANQAPPIPEEVSSTITATALSFMWDCLNTDAADRPTAKRLLDHPFCFHDPHYNFLDTKLYSKLRNKFE